LEERFLYRWCRGFADARRNADWVTFDVGSGNYHFALNK